MDEESAISPHGPLWTPQSLTAEIAAGRIYRSFDAMAREQLALIADLEEKVIRTLQHPKPLDIDLSVFNAVLAAQYLKLFDVLRLPHSMAVYEPCVGASNPVLLAAEAFGEGRASYLTINLNQRLREQLQKKIIHLKTPIRIIDADAQKALDHLPPNSFDVACFHHAVNDILQTAVSEPRGMDTTTIDWFPNERRMIEWLAKDAAAGRLETHAKPALMQIVVDAAKLVRPGGFLLFDHWNWCKFIGVDWFPWDLFYNLIPMTREWIADVALPLKELRFEGVDSQWWLILQVL